MRKYYFYFFFIVAGASLKGETVGKSFIPFIFTFFIVQFTQKYELLRYKLRYISWNESIFYISPSLCTRNKYVTNSFFFSTRFIECTTTSIGKRERGREEEDEAISASPGESIQDGSSCQDNATSATAPSTSITTTTLTSSKQLGDNPKKRNFDYFLFLLNSHLFICRHYVDAGIILIVIHRNAYNR